MLIKSPDYFIKFFLLSEVLVFILENIDNQKEEAKSLIIPLFKNKRCYQFGVCQVI